MKYRKSQILCAVVCVLVILAPNPRGNGRTAVGPDVQESPLLFYHESAMEPAIESFTREFGFDEYVSAGTTEFEKMALLNEWVYGAVPYGLNYRDSELRDGVRILRRARNGQAFLCTNLSAVFIECAVSLGWTARNIYLRKPTGEEHAGNDIWSNQYRKWVYIDPTWNMHIERRGIPLGIHEIRREWIKNRGRDIVYVVGAGTRARRYVSRELPIVRKDSAIWRLIPLGRGWLNYTFQVAVVGRNDYFACCRDNQAGLWDTLYLVRDHFNRKDRRWPFLKSGTVVPPKKLFHDLNRVDVSVPHRKSYRKGPLAVELDGFGPNNHTPNFKEYQVRINDGEWKSVSDTSFTWYLASGPNTLQARIVNSFGVAGPVTEKSISVPGFLKKR
jgi:hypothetical protein